MCGVPFHSASGYLAKLITAGHRVAICEQTEDPALAKGIVKREVVRVLSPGVVTDSQILDDRSNNYICALTRPAKAPMYGLSFLDVSTGQMPRRPRWRTPRATAASSSTRSPASPRPKLLSMAKKPRPSPT